MIANHRPAKVYAFIACLLLFVTSSCSASPNVNTPTLIPTTSPPALTATNPAPTPEHTATPTSEPTRTFTPVPSATLGNTPTEAPPLEPVWVRSLNGAKVRQAPGNEYPALAYYTEGITLTIVGRNSAGDWLVAAISPYNTGWIAANDVSPVDGLRAVAQVAEPAGVATATPIPEIPISISIEFDERFSPFTHREDPVIDIYVKASPGKRVYVEVTAPGGSTVFFDRGKTDHTGIYKTTYYKSRRLGGDYVITASDEAGHTAEVRIFVDNKTNPS